MATKADLAEVRHEIAHLRSDVNAELKLLRYELKMWTGSMAAGLFTSLGGLMAVFKFLVH